MQILMGLIGMVVLLAIALLLSSNRKAINLRTVLGAWLLQVAIGALILYVPAGRKVLLAMSEGVANVIAYGNEGIGFLFGGLVSDKMFEVFGGGGFVFALRVLPVIVFFSSLIAVLYYLGIMQFVIRILGGGLRKILKTSRTESLSATANIFVDNSIVEIYFNKGEKVFTSRVFPSAEQTGIKVTSGNVSGHYFDLKY